MDSPFAVSQSQTVISPTAGRKVDRIFQPISAGAGPEIPNAMIGHMFTPFWCDHIGTTLRTLTD
jgi:hypothetical protein